MTHRVVIVGGGTGGTVLANRLVDALGTSLRSGEATVTLVTDSPNHVYKPVFLYVAFGLREVADGVRPVRDLLDRRVELVVDEVVEIDTDRKRLTGRTGRADRGYDTLVLATGSRLVPETVPGLVEGGHWFYSAEGAERLRDALAGFEGGHLVLSVVGVPHMCPPAPIEFVLMADAWFRERGLRDDVELTYTYPIQRAHGIESLAEWATDAFEARDITLRTFVNPDRVDPEAGALHTMEGETLDYDLLVTIPPHAGAELVERSGLGDDGWVAVDHHTLAVEGAEDVYAIGDTADVPTSKAGSVAHYEAGVVASRIASRVRGRTPTATYDGKTVCFVESGLDEATFLEFGYGEVPTVRAASRTLHWSKLGYNESYWLTARGLV